ncbi:MULTISPECIES: FtsW/RodA/SpoVE family cell cycle protein [Staphylococcus]|jgi:rod shape determining protein RodA|uniref:FtsW/RodA/SpoVE family cell cycle protein n=6 Tax=Staphylococcus TaxID=1279 RepID=A0ABU3ILQ4_STAHA|nr:MULTISPECIES: FtsW/RodA/SpoVE family cell cycle protein [Staphylococcus]AUV67002.1 rod shape-determining protein RodA [Staphylococcus haemolyticus]AUV69382.1 rod shape-determining protein RodA [Staphylococcus haemolyticus]AVH45686.1 rod shape-determining protein RodA [Staphylococcus haemolyticus]AVH48033.1 rod shape-determining protein RodA [Staphylococcus haemolyticus]MBC3014762.1 rod shape-determining protein RodA [Staphylococcus haemolyticus]
MKYSSRQQPSKHWLRKIDWILVALLTILAIISVTTISSAMGGGQYSANFSIRQIIYYILGAIIALVIMLISPKKIRNNTYILYFIFCVLLIGLLILPETSITPIINGAKSWYSFGPVSIQPSEFMKVILILALAKSVSNHNRFTFNKSFQTDLVLFFKIIGISIVPMALILLQNDLGTTLVICAIIIGIMLVSGITWRILAPLFIVAFVFGGTIILAIIYKPTLIESLLGVKMYQMGRINSWLDPYSYSAGDGYHLTESLKAIGSGQLFGKGFNHGEVYIPENHTDFIFSVVGEEMGFLGAVVLLLIFLALIFHLIRLATKVESPFSKIFIIGYVSLLVFHILQNIGMTIQLLPITGIPLPFISYGGSSLWSLMVGIGVVLSIHFHQRQTMPNKEESGT